MAEPLLALSFLQPWLWAILENHKGFELLTYGFLAIENRSWRPPRSIIGKRIALHASAGWDEDGEAFVDDRLILDGRNAESPPKTHCPRGAILGTANVLGAVQRHGGVISGFSSAVVGDRTVSSPWAFGPWCWVLADVRKLAQPIPAKGRLGLWPVPGDLASRIREAEALRA